MTSDRRLTLAVVSVGTAMLLLDVTVVNVALPVIRDDLDASFAELQWVIDAYALTLAATLLTAGALADRIGRRAIFAAGLLAFTLLSAACGAASSGLALDVARGAQGVGAAAMFAASLALLAHEFQGRERGFALGVWGAITGAALAIGPVVGGLLVDGPGWRWVFLVNVALAANHVGTIPELDLPTGAQLVAGIAAGLGIGIVAALMGVAGGELLIPTIVLLYAVDVKLAGSLALAVSLPTMLVAFARYSRDDSFVVLRRHRRFVIAMAAGSIAGTIIGGLMLGVVPAAVLVPLLVALLLASAVKVWRHNN